MDFGKEFGKLCVENQINVIALCRKKPDYECIFLKTDLTDENSMLNTCQNIQKNYNHFNALINCAGIPSIQKLDQVTYQELENLMKVNSMAPMFLASQFINLIKKNEADILNVGSTVGTKEGYSNQMAYTTSKWAIRGTSYNLQLELKKTNCRVIQFNVGGMNTKMHEKYNGTKIENPDEWMNPTDIANIMLYILNLPKNIEISEITINRKNIK